MGSKNDETPTAPTDEVSESTNPAKVIDMQTNIANKIADFTMFKFGENEIRVIDKAGNPWFVAKDVCDVLGIANNRDGIARLDDDEKGVANYLRDNGFDITAPYMEVQSLRHIMLDMRRTLNCIRQDVERSGNKAMTFRL